MTFSISMKTASADLKDSAITKAITTLAANIANSNRSGLVPTGPSLDVTFMLPGKLEKPDFSGMRMGGYEADAKTLYFETAVPEHLLHSTQSFEYVALVMQDVVSNADDFFREQNLYFDTLRWQQLANQVLASANLLH